MKKLVLFLMIIAAFSISFRHHFIAINPTGTYILKGKIQKNIIKGHNGEIRAKLLSENKLLLRFYLNNGYPNFESASFTDSFFYFDDRISYHNQTDTDCIISFAFNEHSIETFFIHSDPECKCGFSKGIIIPATFEKVSSDIPIFQDFQSEKPVQGK